MKRRLWITLLSCEAALCVLLSFVWSMLPGVFTTVLAFPYEQIALGLRLMSLRGGAANTAAIVLYVVVCLLPLLILLLIRRKRQLAGCDVLLGILSPVLFAVLYLMINPGLYVHFDNVITHSFFHAMLGLVADSILVGYIITLLLRLFSHADRSRLERCMSVLLGVLCVVFVYAAFGAGLRSLLDSFADFRASNTGTVRTLALDLAFLTVQYLVNALPYVLDLVIAFAALRLLHQLAEDRYAQATVTAAERLARTCAAALKIIVTVNIAFNLLQLALVNRLRTLSFSLNLPILSVAFALAALLLAQFIRENKQLKDDNNLFI